MADNVTAVIADYVADAQWADLPESLRHEAKRALLNHFAAAFGGCRDDAVTKLLALLAPMAGPPQAGLIGRHERLDALNAAFVNAAISNVLDFCDTHLATVIHPTAPVAPGLFALAEQRRTSGATLLHAFAMGVDIACRIGNAISPGHYARGWHITGTCGVLGAALAAGKVIGLDRRQLRVALGCAATQACGLVETLGFDAKSLNVGNAARNGLFAALLAEQGFAGPDRPIEGQRGFLAVMGQSPDLSQIIEGLGRRSELAVNTYKPYPCGVVLHPVIDACLELRARPGFDSGLVERVVVRGHPLLKERADRQVTTGREAQVCLGHTVAVALLLGRAGPAEYTDACVNDPGMRAFAARVAMAADGTIPVEAAEVTVSARDGTVSKAHVAQARGSVGRPLSDAEIEAKLRALAAPHIAGPRIDRLVDAVWSLDRLDDAAVPIRLAAVSAASPPKQI